MRLFCVLLLGCKIFKGLRDYRNKYGVKSKKKFEYPSALSPLSPPLRTPYWLHTRHLCLRYFIFVLFCCSIIKFQRIVFSKKLFLILVLRRTVKNFPVSMALLYTIIAFFRNQSWPSRFLQRRFWRTFNVSRCGNRCLVS